MERAWYAYLFFFVMMTATMAGVHYYLWHRLVHEIRLPERLRTLLTVKLIALFAILMSAFPIFRVVPREVGYPLVMLAFSWMGWMFILFTLVFARDGLRLVARPARKGPGFNPERRLLLKRTGAAGIGFVAGVTGLYSMRNALHELHTKQVHIRLPRWPASMKGYRIVQVTDIHIGPTIGRTFVTEVVRRINALQPDLVVITGDLVDGSVEQLREHAAPLADIQSRHGTFFAVGNHEYYSGLTSWMDHLNTLGIPTLLNERVTIGEGDRSFDLVGIDDETGNPDPTPAVEGRDPNRELVVLAHQPRSIRHIEHIGAGLVLSGHTHGGQIRPFNLLVRLVQPYVTGLHQHGDMQIYVSPGTGYWGPPMRLGTQAEITEVIVS